MAFTTVAQIKEAVRTQTRMYKVNTTLAATSASTMCHSFTTTFDLYNWTTPSNPSSGLSGNVPDYSTVGAIKGFDPTGSDNYLVNISGNLLTSASISTNQVATAMLYDRLWHNSGINVTLTTEQTVNSVAFTRPDANGVGAEIWLDCYVNVTGTAASVVTVSYTNSAGVSGRTATVTLPTSTIAAGTSLILSLQAEDAGVKSIESITFSLARTAGTMGLVVRRRLAMYQLYPVVANLDFLSIPMTKIPANACLEHVFINAVVYPITAGFTIASG